MTLEGSGKLSVKNRQKCWFLFLLDFIIEVMYNDSILKFKERKGEMNRIRQFFGNLIVRVGQIVRGPEPPKVLQVIFHFGPNFELLADYYDSSWSPRDGAMFGKSYLYPLRHRVLAIYEAVEYAKSNGYDLLRVDALAWGKKSPQFVGTVPITH